jgi:hypothetical protein
VTQPPTNKKAPPPTFFYYGKPSPVLKRKKKLFSVFPVPFPETFFYISESTGAVSIAVTVHQRLKVESTFVD